MTIKTILAGSAAALALTGGIAYAATTGSPPAAARAAVTSAVLAQGQYTIALARYGRYGWLYADHRCDWRGQGSQRQPAQLTSHRQPARLVSHRQPAGYQHRGGYGYQGNRGYRSGWSGSGSQWGHGSGRCEGCR